MTEIELKTYDVIYNFLKFQGVKDTHAKTVNLITKMKEVGADISRIGFDSTIASYICRNCGYQDRD